MHNSIFGIATCFLTIFIGTVACSGADFEAGAPQSSGDATVLSENPPASA